MSSFTVPDDINLDDLLDEDDLYDDDDNDNFLNIYSSTNNFDEDSAKKQTTITINVANAIPIAKTIPIAMNILQNNSNDKNKQQEYNNLKQKFTPPNNSNYVNMTSEQRLKFIRNYNETIEINKKNMKFEKQQAGKIADEIRKNRALKEQREKASLDENVENKSTDNMSYLQLFTSTLQRIKSRAQETVLYSSITGTMSDEIDVPLHELWSEVFQQLNEEYKEYDVKARQNDDYFVNCILKKVLDKVNRKNEDSNESNDWDEFRNGILKIIKSSPRHSLSKTLRVFSHTLCLLHGPLFDLETEVNEMLQNNSHIFSNFVKKKDLINDIKCFVEMLVITIARKYNIERSSTVDLLLYVASQSAIFDMLGERIDGVMFLKEIRGSLDNNNNNNNKMKSSTEKNTRKTNTELFDDLHVKDIFRNYKVNLANRTSRGANNNTTVSTTVVIESTRVLEPYAVAINQLKCILTMSNYPLGRLKILYNVLELVTKEMSEVASSHGKKISVGAEDLAPVIDFVIIKSEMSHILNPILKSLEDLIPNSFWSGRYAYALTTFSISVGSMNQGC